MSFEVMKKRREELKQIDSEIERISIYNAKNIGPILAKLMTEFEGIEYVYNPLYDDIREREVQEFPIKLHIPNLENELKYNKLSNKPKQYFLPPIGFLEEEYIKNDALDYVRCFIEYLNTKRIEEKLYTIDDTKLEELLNHYIKIKESNIQTRHNCRMEYINQLTSEKLEKERQEKCMIDRTSFFSALVYLLNHDNTFEFNAFQKYENIIEETNGGPIIKSYHTISAHTLLHKVKASSKIASTKVLYGTDLNEVKIDFDNNNLINFYKFKEQIIILYTNSILVKEFIDKLEEIYLSKFEITEEDILTILADIRNETKGMSKNLTKNEKIYL